MKHEVTITKEAIDEAALLGKRALSKGMGAAIYFSGFVRELEGESRIEAIEYEAFEAMVLHQFELIFGVIQKQWPIESIRLVHRVGRVEVNQASLWVEVIAPHRGEAFAACQFLIDEMKRAVPIWKRPVGLKTRVLVR